MLPRLSPKDLETLHAAHRACLTWAAWVSGRDENPDPLLTLEDLEALALPASAWCGRLVRWMFDHVPLYRDLPDDRARWRKLRREAWEHHRAWLAAHDWRAGPSGPSAILAAMRAAPDWWTPAHRYGSKERTGRYRAPWYEHLPHAGRPYFCPRYPVG